MATARRALGNALAAAAIGALILAFFWHAFLNYDTFYALVWGDDLVHGRTPRYDVPVAPTPHPLATAVGAVASLFGDTGEAVMLGVVLFAIGWLVVGVYRLRRGGFPRAGGLLAAGILCPRRTPAHIRG